MSRIGRQGKVAIWLLILLTMMICPSLAERLNEDTVLCSNDNTPVCARSQREYLLFKNECDLRKAQRENLMGGPLFDVALQSCVPSCDFECDDGFHPICGVSVTSGERKTFRNRCEMARNSCNSKSDWLVYKWGVCPTSKTQPKQDAHTVLVGQRKRRQPIPCTNVYRPVCASYAGVKSTFSNECLVNAENIRTRRNWRVISEGLCGEDSIKMKHSRKLKPKSKPKVEIERSKRSHKQLNQLDDLDILEDAVQIFAPSTFHTQFISNSGTMEKSYSLPARKPYLTGRPKSRGRNEHSRVAHMNTLEVAQSQRQSSIRQSGKPCVFSNEPVCGSFNGESRTFANVCALMEYSQAVGNAWTILYDGDCRRCDKRCPTVYSPICANRNGINHTIINECYLDRVRCKDPNTDWKIVHKGECTPLNEEVYQSIPKPKQTPLSRIPLMLYTPKHIESSSSTMPMSTSKPKTTTPLPSSVTPRLTPRRQFRKLRRPTPTPKDLSNRKIRKIESVGFNGYDPNMPSNDLQAIKMPAASKVWATKDNWVMDQSLDDIKNKFNKKPNSKNTYREKYLHYSWPMTQITPTQLLSTTAESTTSASTSVTMDTFDGITNAELLNVGCKSAETATNPQILFEVGKTTLSARTSETEATTRPTTTLAQHIKAAPTEATTTLPSRTTPLTTPTTKATTRTTTMMAPVMHETSTMLTSTTEPEASTSNASTILDEGTTEALDRSTTIGTVEATASTTSAALTAASAASTASSEISTISSLDYTADEPLLNQSRQTSIYGLDKNSLIMRLLRARSSKNMVI